MHRFSRFGWIALLLIAAIDTAELNGQAPAPAAKKAILKQPSLAELAKLYQDLDLPLPPKKAFFAIVDEGPSLQSAPASKPTIYYQFVLATGGPYPSAPYLVWKGFHASSEETLAKIFLAPPSPEAVLPFIGMRRLRGHFEPMDENRGELAFAIQCQLLGHRELADFFYKRCEKAATSPLDQALVLTAWQYWGTELGNTKRDLALVAKKLHHIVDKHRFFELLTQGPPSEKEEIDRDVKDHQTLLDRLELTIKASTAKPGSVEALIDELLGDPSAAEGWDLLPLEEEKPKGKGQSTQEGGAQAASTPERLDAKTVLTNMGFAAIPALIEHVDDQRLVRHAPLFLGGTIGLAQENGSRIMTVNARSFRTIGPIVREILRTFFLLDEHKATKADYLKSWDEMKAMSEADFVTAALADPEKRPWEFFQFARLKYKEKCIECYRMVLRKNLDVKWVGFLIDAMIQSNLTPSEKIDLLVQGADKGSLFQKYKILEELTDLDHATFCRLFILALKNLKPLPPTDYDQNYFMSILDLGLRAEEATARAVFENHMKTLPHNLKLEFLGRQVHSVLLDGQINPKLWRFLVKFLDDKTLYAPNDTDQQAWFILKGELTRIETRNFVAKNILERLGIMAPVNDHTSAETWTKIRELAKDEVERRLEKQGKK